MVRIVGAMPECPRLPGCAFFNNKLKALPATAEMAKKSFCRANYEGCARYLVARYPGLCAVPDDLYPDQVERARELLAGKTFNRT